MGLFKNIGKVLKGDYAANSPVEGNEEENAVQLKFSEGIDLIREEQYFEAIEYFRKIIKLQPDLAEAHYNIAFAKYKVGQQDEAII